MAGNVEFGCQNIEIAAGQIEDAGRGLVARIGGADGHQRGRSGTARTADGEGWIAQPALERNVAVALEVSDHELPRGVDVVVLAEADQDVLPGIVTAAAETRVGDMDRVGAGLGEIDRVHHIRAVGIELKASGRAIEGVVAETRHVQAGARDRGVHRVVTRRIVDERAAGAADRVGRPNPAHLSSQLT